MENTLTIRCMDAVLEDNIATFVNISGEILAYDTRTDTVSYKGSLPVDSTEIIRKIVKIADKYYFIANEYCRIYEYTEKNAETRLIYDSGKRGTRVRDVFVYENKVFCFPVDLKYEIVMYDEESGRGELLPEIGTRIYPKNSKQLYFVCQKNESIFLSVSGRNSLYKYDLKENILDLYIKENSSINSICCSEKAIFARGDNCIAMYEKGCRKRIELDSCIEQIAKLIYHNGKIIMIPVKDDIGIVDVEKSSCKVINQEYDIVEEKVTFSIGIFFSDSKVFLLPWRLKNIVVIDTEKDSVEERALCFDESMQKYLVKKCFKENTNYIFEDSDKGLSWFVDAINLL